MNTLLDPSFWQSPVDFGYFVLPFWQFMVANVSISGLVSFAWFSFLFRVMR